MRGIFWGILLIPHNNVMDLNNVMYYVALRNTLILSCVPMCYCGSNVYNITFCPSVQL